MENNKLMFVKLGKAILNLDKIIYIKCIDTTEFFIEIMMEETIRLDFVFDTKELRDGVYNSIGEKLEKHHV
jgi:hypothetical protein